MFDYGFVTVMYENTVVSLLERTLDGQYPMQEVSSFLNSGVTLKTARVMRFIYPLKMYHFLFWELFISWNYFFYLHNQSGCSIVLEERVNAFFPSSFLSQQSEKAKKETTKGKDKLKKIKKNFFYSFE